MKDKYSKIAGFKIFVDQLKKGHVEKIDESFDPDFMLVQEKDLAFEDPIKVKGEAYTAEGELILHLDLATEATLPCSICNGPAKVPIHVKNFYHNEPLAEIKSGVFSMRDVIRDAILLDTPPFAECHEGHCPERKDIEKYLKKPKSPQADSDLEDGYKPFEGLKLE